MTTDIVPGVGGRWVRRLKPAAGWQGLLNHVRRRLGRPIVMTAWWKWVPDQSVIVRTVSARTGRTVTLRIPPPPSAPPPQETTRY